MKLKLGFKTYRSMSRIPFQKLINGTGDLGKYIGDGHGSIEPPRFTMY